MVDVVNSHDVYLCIIIIIIIIRHSASRIFTEDLFVVAVDVYSISPVDGSVLTQLEILCSHVMHSDDDGQMIKRLRIYG